MAKPSWDDTEELAPSMDETEALPSWDDTTEVPGVSKTESGARGLAQGASMGYADELTGGAEALWEMAKGDPRTFGELYRQFRDESRANYKSAEEANPGTYMAGQVGGAVGTSLIPGVGLAKGAGLLANAGKLAAVGAAEGLGASEADLTQGDIAGAAIDTAKGAAIGGGIGLAVPGGAKLAKKGLEAVAESPLLARVAKMQPGPRLAEKGLEYLDLADPIVMPKATKTLSELTPQELMEYMAKNAQQSATGMKGMTPAGMATKQAAADTVTEAAKPRSAPSLLDAFRGPAPSTAGKSMGRNITEQVGGRLSAYGAGSIPFVGGVPASLQAASDAALVAQKGAQFTLDSIIPRMGKFQNVLTQAATRGPESLAATHYVLQQTDPEYREQSIKAMDEGEENDWEEQ